MFCFLQKPIDEENASPIFRRLVHVFVFSSNIILWTNWTTISKVVNHFLRLFNHTCCTFQSIINNVLF